MQICAGIFPAFRALAGDRLWLRRAVRGCLGLFRALVSEAGFAGAVFVKINGKRHQLWRAVDHEGEVLESFVTNERNKKAASKLLGKLRKRHGAPREIVTDRRRSYGAALGELGIRDRQQIGRWMNNRTENAHLPFRPRVRAMLRFCHKRTVQKFATVHVAVHNHFNTERSLSSRPALKANRATALAEWRGLCAP